MSTSSLSASRSDPIRISALLMGAPPQLTLAIIPPTVKDQANGFSFYANSSLPEQLKVFQEASQQYGIPFEAAGPKLLTDDND